MFTGIVEHVGRVEAVEVLADLTRFRIDVGPVAQGVALGDSIAVCGACLTVTEIAEAQLCFEAIPETLERTKLGGLSVGNGVNLERAMGVGARFDGHIVQGHVDGIGRVRRFDRRGNDVELHIECGAELAAQLVDKGSVTIDGVSLTVVAVCEDGFHVALIPHTLGVTTLSTLAVGDAVNLEVDVFGKYVKQYLDRILPDLEARLRNTRDDASR
jgi:riboflavin synthase